MTHDFQQRERIERAIAGDQTALERLLMDSYEPLQAHLIRQLAPEIQAVVGVDDLLQQVFAQVFRDNGSFTPSDDNSLMAWFKTIADNRLRDAIRHHRRQKRGGDFRRTMGKPEGDSPFLNDLINEYAVISQTPSREIARDEAVQAIQIAIASLPDDHRRVVQLRYFDGLTVEEAARVVGKTTGAVRGLLDRAKVRIREMMQTASCYFSDS